MCIMKKFVEVLKKRKVAAIICVVLIAVIGYGVWFVQDMRNAVEVASSHVDPELETILEEEDTPLAAAPKVTTKTTKSTKTTKKTVKLSKAATKTYTSKLPNKTKKTTKTVKKNATTTVKTDTAVLTEVTEKYTKASKNKAVTTKVTTTVKTTTTVKAAVQTSNTVTTTTVEKSASKMNAKIRDAWTKMGFTIVIDPSVSYSGYFNARDKKMTLRADDDTIYHEMGHFLGFMAGNYDTSSKFQAVYKEESGKYKGFNKAYVTQNASEYFAEALRDYTLNGSALKSERPKTYASIEEAISKLTSAQITKMQLVMRMY